MTAPETGGGRVLALDVGTRRIGVAVCDPSRQLASPLSPLLRSAIAADGAAVTALLAEFQTHMLVIGHPRRLSGERGPAALAVEAYVAQLRRHLPPEVEISLVDERLTTVVALRSLQAQGVRGKAQRARVDGLAATEILTTWLAQQQRSDGS